MDTTAFVRDALQQAHSFLALVMEDVTDEQAHWTPGGRALPIGAHYAHLLTGEDGFVNGFLKQSAPLFVSTWAGRTGISDLPPQLGPGQTGMPAWDGWARKVRVELPALREYAQAVGAASDEYVASLTHGDLRRLIDLAPMGLGHQTLAWVLSAGLVGHVWSHLGEISCLKGLQGARGYPV